MRSTPYLPLLVASCFLAPADVRAQTTIEQVEALELKAFQAFQAGRFQGCVDALEQAFSLRPDPRQLVRMLKCHDRLGSDCPARRRVVARIPTVCSGCADEAALAVAARDVELDCVKPELAATVVAPEPPAPPEPVPAVSTREIVGWSALGLGLAGTAVGAVFAVQATDRIDARQERALNGQPIAGLQTGIDDAQLWTGVGFAVGGAALLTGLGLLLWPDDPATAGRVNAGGLAWAF